jgi:hypothetical protein
MGDQPSTIQEFLGIVRKHGLEYFGMYYGKYRGEVINNQDPQKLGRVQLRIPQIAGDNKVEYWAWPSGQPAGADFGDFMIPPKGSPVWVTFENGDPSHPCYEGGHWGKSAKGVPTGGSGNPNKRVRSSEKWRTEMDDENDKIFFEHKENGHKFEITGDGKITMSGGSDFAQTTGGNHSQEVAGNKSTSCVNFGLNATGDSSFDLGGVTITCGGGVLEISVGGSNVKISGSGVEIMHKDFLTHHHTGVQTGGSNTGDVA